MELVSWRVDRLFNADAQKVYEEIGDTNITPQEVLNRAKDENTELHKCFEWDDAIAGEKYRLSQAGDVLRMLVITKTVGNETPVRVFQITSEKNTYAPSRKIVVNKEEYQKLLDRALRELENFKRRYSTLSELEGIFNSIDELINN